MKKSNQTALAIAVILPILLAVFVPRILQFMNLSREQNKFIKMPGKMYAIDTVQLIDYEGKMVVDSVYHKVPNMKFQTQSGDSLELDSLKGNLYVANFFFATCPGICPKLSNSMERVQSAFIKDEKFKMLSITVDPERDSVQALRGYADNHNAIPGKWYYLRGSQQNISELAGKGLYITARPGDPGDAEAFVHSEKLVMVDWEGNIRGYYSGIDSLSVNKMMADIVLLLRSKDRKTTFSGNKPKPH